MSIITYSLSPDKCFLAFSNTSETLGSSNTFQVSMSRTLITAQKNVFLHASVTIFRYSSGSKPSNVFCLISKSSCLDRLSGLIPRSRQFKCLGLGLVKVFVCNWRNIQLFLLAFCWGNFRIVVLPDKKNSRVLGEN